MRAQALAREGWGWVLLSRDGAAAGECGTHPLPLPFERERMFGDGCAEGGELRLCGSSYSLGQVSRTSTKRVSQRLVWWPSTTRWSMVSET